MLAPHRSVFGSAFFFVLLFLFWAFRVCERRVMCVKAKEPPDRAVAVKNDVRPHSVG